tara:strand:+ start:540 stop:1358 length:819 start_codon:yes stop_codon:yes gene_type:complete
MSLSFNKQLKEICNKKNNRLCIGLDIDPDKFIDNRNMSIDSMEHFLKEVIDGTIDFCPIYKPNFAFYERFGSQGYALLERIVGHISGKAIVIADAKRGDIGNTSKQYAFSIFENMGCDAITISPYMGRDAIDPFLHYDNKGVFILAMTSNKSATEIQNNKNDVEPLHERIIKIANELNVNDNIGLVVGATNTEKMNTIRKSSKDMPWLIPGIGAQGGDLEKSVSISNQNGIGIINVSRGILYAGNGSMEDVIQSAKKYTEKIRNITCNLMTC